LGASDILSEVHTICFYKNNTINYTSWILLKNKDCWEYENKLVSDDQRKIPNANLPVTKLKMFTLIIIIFCTYFLNKQVHNSYKLSQCHKIFFA
jgi:hypothetical protein